MQLIPRYLVNNRTAIISNDAGFITEYRPVYSRQLQVYRGIDNVLEFRLLNADQKPIDLAGYTPKFQAYDENDRLVIEHNGVAQSLKGLFTVTITDNDTLNLKQQYLSYNIHLVDSNNNSTMTYSDVAFNSKGTIKLSSEAFPGPLLTKEVTFPTGYLVSSSITAEPGINGNEALHTAAVYTDGYVGSIVVQATLDNQVTDSTSWADITTLPFTGTETEPKSINFNGVFSHLRFVADADPANKISKILVRN